jgi:hypothetical protein
MKLRLSKEQRRKLKEKGWVVNVAETEAQKIFKELSIDFRRRGYPDFTILKDNEIYGFIEVKPNSGKDLRIDQQRFQRFCIKHNIPFLKWTPESGAESIKSFIEV